MTQGAGTGKTPERVVELLRTAVVESSQSALARVTGVNQAAIGRYLKGVGEPNTATLEKLAKYFNCSVAELRGEPELIQVRFGKDEMVSMFRNIAVEIAVPAETIKQVGIAVILDIQQGKSDEQIVSTVRGLEKTFSLSKAKGTTE